MLSHCFNNSAEGRRFSLSENISTAFATRIWSIIIIIIIIIIMAIIIIIKNKKNWSSLPKFMYLFSCRCHVSNGFYILMFFDHRENCRFADACRLDDFLGPSRHLTLQEACWLDELR